MGFYLRKSVRVGLLRFNLSNGGVGVSGGIPGLRIGTGPRGTYVHAGRGGLYYRAHLFPTKRRRGRVPVRPPEIPRSASIDGLLEISSAPAEQIRDESSDAVLAEIRDRRGRVAVAPLAFWGFAALAIAWASLQWPAIALLPFIAVPTIVWAFLRDETGRTTVLLYDLESDAHEAFRALHDAFAELAACSRIWNVDAAGATKDYKYNAGATQLLRRRKTIVGFAPPPGIRTNVPVPSVALRSETLYFFPERVFVVAGKNIGAVSYEELQDQTSVTRFIEEEPVPGDGRVADHTWKYLNKNGTPDRRFSRNPRLPILAYGQLFLASTSGLRGYLQSSREHPPAQIAAALVGLRAVATRSPERPKALS